MQLMFQAPTSAQSRISSEESAIIRNQIEGFYSWYMDLIRDKKLNDDFNPSFVRKNDGMTALDFTNYRNGLKRFKFTDDFIQTKINDYQQCVDNLANVPFEKFKEFQDLDDFEGISCDFRNTYEWIGSMEPIYSAELSYLSRVNKKKILGVIKFNSSTSALLTFKKIGDEWKIDNLTIDIDTNE